MKSCTALHDHDDGEEDPNHAKGDGPRHLGSHCDFGQTLDGG